MDFEHAWFEDDFESEPFTSGAMQEVCTQLGELWIDIRSVKERIYELEMRAGMHAPDTEQLNLF